MYRTVHRFAKHNIGKKVTDDNVRDAPVEQLFNCHIDVQWRTDRLNYINGYTTKAQDSMDFRLDSETGFAGPHGRWLTAYRLLSRRTVCIPEVALWLHEANPVVRSFRIWKCYAPTPWTCDKKNSESERLNEFYLRQFHQIPPAADHPRTSHPSSNTEVERMQIHC